MSKINFLGEWILSPARGGDGEFLILDNEGCVAGVTVEEDATAIAALPDLYRELRESGCPRPANNRPNGFTVGECVDCQECGCSAGGAVAKAEGREPNDGASDV